MNLIELILHEKNAQELEWVTNVKFNLKWPSS